MAHDVFISYASSDKAVADAVCSQLESLHRIRCWIAPRDVTPGASWAESIIDALDGSKVMVLIFSSKANASMQIEREVERAVHKGINIIPLRIENTVPTKTLEYFISSPHWLDAISVPLEGHINKLAASVKALLSKQGIQHRSSSSAGAAGSRIAGGCSCGCSGARRCRGFTIQGEMGHPGGDHGWRRRGGARRRNHLGTRAARSRSICRCRRGNDAGGHDAERTGEDHHAGDGDCRRTGCRQLRRHLCRPQLLLMRRNRRRNRRRLLRPQLRTPQSRRRAPRSPPLPLPPLFRGIRTCSSISAIPSRKGRSRSRSTARRNGHRNWGHR